MLYIPNRYTNICCALHLVNRISIITIKEFFLTKLMGIPSTCYKYVRIVVVATSYYYAQECIEHDKQLADTIKRKEVISNNTKYVCLNIT